MATFIKFTENQSNQVLTWVVLAEQMRGLTVPQLSAEIDNEEQNIITIHNMLGGREGM